MRQIRLLIYLLVTSCTLTSVSANTVAELFQHHHQTQLLMDIEVAMARAQAKHDVIPAWAAEEIMAKADAALITEEALAAEFRVVRHRMVAFLKVWGREMDKGAEQYVHFGTTTVDIYDTLLVLQLLESLDIFINDLRTIEEQLMVMAEQYKATPMVGRTLGQHALPITLGKKFSGWLAENRRNIERLKDVRLKLRQSAILKGAVGSYLGLGDKAMLVERDFAEFLKLDRPYADDWHGSRDVFAEYAQVLALISKSFNRWGQEVFLLQSTDIAELTEVRPGSAVSSSSMPHKNNPSRSEALIYHGRLIPRLAEVALDDVVNFYERDNTSRSNRNLSELAIAAASMFNDAKILISRIAVNEEAMLANLYKTDGMLTANRLVYALAPDMGKATANEHVIVLARKAQSSNQPFVDVLLADDTIQQYLNEQQIRALVDPITYQGLDSELVDAVIMQVKAARINDPVSNTAAIP